MESVTIPKNSPGVYFTKISDVAGMIPLVAITNGQVVTSNDVAKPSQELGAQSAFLPIAEGYVAVTIPTSEQQGVANYVQPDDYISVIATVQTSGKVASKTIFTNLHVIKVGMEGATGGNTATSLTVVVTQCQAEVITFFLGYAALKYTLESYKDYLSATAQSPDPACPTVNSATGVTVEKMRAAYPTLF
jgi:Flp pilus assembly protein CpaB